MECNRCGDIAPPLTIELKEWQCSCFKEAPEKLAYCIVCESYSREYDGAGHWCHRCIEYDYADTVEPPKKTKLVN